MEDSPSLTEAPSVISHPLEPIYDAHSRILILGTMPSPTSRERGFFYSHPQNRFWPVLTYLLNEEDPLTNEGRTALLLRNHIALWDVIASCKITGAADSSIQNVIPCDLNPLFKESSLAAIFTTGAKAFQLFKRFNEAPPGVALVSLPSTSPANARMSFHDLVTAYEPIRDYLGKTD